MKQRQRTSQRSRDSEEETRSERSVTAASSERAAGLTLSCGGLLYLCVPLILSGLYVQQGWRLSEVEQKYESLLERSRSSEHMEEKMEEISAQCSSVHALVSAVDTGVCVSQMESVYEQVSELQQGFSSLSLQSTQATLRRSASYSADLQPTLRSTHTRLNTLEKRLDELTLRIGHIAQDVLHYNTQEEEHRGDMINNTQEEEHRGDMINNTQEEEHRREHLEKHREDMINTEDKHLEKHRDEEQRSVENTEHEDSS